MVTAPAATGQATSESAGTAAAALLRRSGEDGVSAGVLSPLF
jgi:hypothetical protein